MDGNGLTKSKILFPVVIMLFILWFGVTKLQQLQAVTCLNVTLLEIIREPNRSISKDNCFSKIEQNSPSLIWQRGYLLWKDGQREKALSIWRQAPQYSAAMLLEKIEINQDVNYRMSQTALLLDPFSDEVSENISFYLLQKDEVSLAHQFFDGVYQQNPDNAVAMMVLALTTPMESGDTSNILALFDKALIKAPENIYVIRYGFRVINRLDIGETRIRKLIQITETHLPNDFEIIFALGNSYARLGDYWLAEQYNLMALDINPMHSWANLQQAEYRQKLGITEIQPWAERATTFRVQSRPDYYKRLLTVLLYAGEIDTAKKIYCEAVVNNDYPSEIFKNLIKDHKRIFACN